MDKVRAEKFMAAADRALAAFPITPAKVELHWESENVTFRVTEAETGARFVLRLHRHDYHTIKALNSERVWTQALGEAGIAAPVAVLTRMGEHFHSVDMPGEPPRFAGMTQWMEGTPMVGLVDAEPDLPEHIESFRQIGVLTATLHDQSSAWTIPPDFERHVMDSEGLIGEAPFWGRFWEHPDLTDAESRLMLRGRDQVCAAIAAYGQTPANYGLIHADLHTENILITDTGVAPIDFDDAGFGWHVYDLAVVLFSERDKPQYAAFRAAVLAGYQERRALTDRDLAMLDVFILIRAMVLIGWVYQRPEVDNDGYFEELRDTVCAGCEAFEAVP